MKSTLDPHKYRGTKRLLVIAALVFGILAFFIGCFFSGSFVFSVFFAVFAAVMYVLLSRNAARLVIALRTWAYCGQTEPSDDEKLLSIAVWWPVALIPGAVYYTFMGIINRSF